MNPPPVGAHPGTIACYFAYGSNMNPHRVRERGIRFVDLAGAQLPGFRLDFDKASARHPGVGHANIHIDPQNSVEGVLYWLEHPAEIGKMDRFESTPVNYSRDVIVVHTSAGPVPTWTYFANPAVRKSGLQPNRSYLNHLLEGREYLSASYFARLAGWECVP